MMCSRFILSDELLRMPVPCVQAASATYSSPAGGYWSPGSWSVATNSWSPGAWVQTPGSPQQYGQAPAQAGPPGLTTYSPQQYGRGATQQSTSPPVNQLWTPTPTWTPAPSVSHCPVTCISITPSHIGFMLPPSTSAHRQQLSSEGPAQLTLR